MKLAIFKTVISIKQNNSIFIIIYTTSIYVHNYQRGDGDPINQFNTSTYLCLSQGMSFLLSFLCCSLILGERWLFPLLILVEIMTFNTQYQYVSSYNRYSNMTSFKRFGSKSVVKYA